MTNLNLTVLSYHKFGYEPSDYPFSRTYEQFETDIVKRDYDLITFDDADYCQVKACAMLQAKNIRSKLFVPSDLIGKDGYCSEADIWKLSRFHDIENHSHQHIKLSGLDYAAVKNQIATCNNIVRDITGRTPRFLVAPWNEVTETIKQAAKDCLLQLVTDRITIKNDS